MTAAVFDFRKGSTPLVVSIPHDGRELPPDIADRMTPTGRALRDTDWHVRELYGFATDLGASVIAARYSRYVIDLNRPASDEALYPGQRSTGLCPERAFDGDPLYVDGAGVSREEREARIGAYWRPYHDKLAAELARVVAVHGYALLWDAHSIRGEVPALFDGELPTLNLGTYGGRSCAAGIEQALSDEIGRQSWRSIVNGRFKGGHITRHYGRPDDGRHAVQMEIAQRSYMDENTLRYDAQRGNALAGSLRALLETYLRAGEAIAAR